MNMSPTPLLHRRVLLPLRQLVVACLGALMVLEARAEEPERRPDNLADLSIE